MKTPALLSAGILLAGISAWGGVVLNEIVSQNSPDGFAAADGNNYDWIELFNSSPEEVDLTGAYLTDDGENLTKWRFHRNFIIPPGGFAIVFASDLNDIIEGQEHLNFKLDAGDGEYLALVGSDGEEVLSEINPSFPPLGTNHAFGLSAEEKEHAILLNPTPGETNSVAAPLPGITSLEASETVIANGESITISWETINSETLTLKTSSSLNTVVAPNGSIVLRPTYNQTVTLTARNGYAVSSKTIEILVSPAIKRFSANPALIANGGQTVLRWEATGSDQVVELNQTPVTSISPPTKFTPTNVNLIPPDATWKKTPDFPGEGWQDIDFDDSAWSEDVPPFQGDHYYRKTFQVSDPDSLAIAKIQISRSYNLHLSLNGQTILTPGPPNRFADTLNGAIQFDPGLLRDGENILTATLSSQFGDYDIRLDAWRSQPVDTVIPVTLVARNEAGEESRTVDITVLAEGTQLPPLPAVAISEFFWAYNGTFPVEPYRFFEFQNCGEQSLDLSGIQLIGDSYFSFAEALETNLHPDNVVVVVAHHPTFAETWPGDRNVIGQIEDPQQSETYQFDFELALLDPFGRSFEHVSTRPLPEFGDFLQTFERADPKAPSNESTSWFIDREYGNGFGGGTPGELPFRIIDFSFDPPAASPGETVSLKWEVSRPVDLQISEGIGPVSGTSGSIDLIIPEDARSFRFWLNAETTFTNRDRLTTLILPPSITSFSSSKSTIFPGEEVTFRWGQAIPYVSSQIELSPEVPPGIYGSSHTFTPLLSGFQKGRSWRTRAHETPPKANWHTVDFAEIWRNRSAALGFGSEGLTTELTPRNWLTAYFRRRFQITEADEIEELCLDVLNDDGIEIFLNGQEVVRDNLPQGAIDYLTPALSKFGPSERTFKIDPALLVEGENVIAVGVHNSSINDNDLVFDLGLRAKRQVPQSGRKTFTFTTTNQAGSDSAQITLLFQEALSIADWQTNYGLIGDAKNSDSDEDGFTDFFEYVTGSNPLERSANPVSISRDQERFLTISYPHNLISESNFLQLQKSSDLANWENLRDFKFEGSIAPNGSNVARVTYRSYSPVREAGYFRLITN